ncbi:AAEL010308-PA, partial [Aedes aegypti]
GISDNSNVNKSISMQEIEKSQRSVSEDPDVRNALAFTIEFSEGRKSVDTQRHEKMLERFQNRHKRGVSLSKLESGVNTPVGKMRTPQSVNLPRKNRIEQPEIQDTAVRLRDKSRTSRDSVTKRHSWSPRSSMTEAGVKDSAMKMKTNKFTPKSSALQMAFDQQNIMKDSCSSSEFNAESLDSSIGLPCVQPPLENFKKENEDDDSISEAGTYTLDGDNYTEEQKERMNIDRMPAFTPESTPKPLFKQGSNKLYPQRPTSFREELEIIDLDRPCSGTSENERRKNNVLEVVYFHEPSPQINSPDQGTFTSVTTSGILSVKPTLESHPRIHRRNSLTKSHIDSSEYVQGVAKLNIHKNEDEAKILNCYTDSEKATGLSDLNVNYDHQRRKADSEASNIGSAVNKKDWIQEWAKNAREYAKKPTPSSSNPQMVRSYEFENRNQFGYDFDIDMTKSDYYDTKKYQEFGDNLDRQHLHRKQLDRLLNNSSNSDPMLKQAYGTDSSAPNSGEFTRRGSIRQYTSPTAAKPPMSPSKIPSPMGSIGRARSDLSTNETEMYLQKTAAAITTLQNLQRRNSLRNSSRQNSSHSNRNEDVPGNDMADYDDDEKLIVITSGVKDMSLGTKKPNAVLIKQQSSSSSSVKPTGAQIRPTGSQPVNKSYNPKPVPTQISSPIKRSSSFSVKAMKPMTPTLTPKLGSKIASGGSRIQKSASSTSFKKMVANYNDEDDFYINDDDDLELGPEYSSSSEISDKDEEGADVDKEPITNTRYNKTFLMRMEQNKKIAAGVKHGVAACPNTPELPRRTLQVKGSTRDRASMPRDSSLNRMKQDMAASRKSMGRESVPKEPATGGKQKVQPKYLDISKYKNPTAGTFLKKDESKSYLIKSEVKKSPSSAAVAMNRAEPSRMSTRSIKSAGAKPTPSNQKVTKEQELEMWRRRASYDPMKAAMEGKKKQEEARRHVQNQAERSSKSCESSVLRSQSCHSGVGVGTGRLYSSNISNNTNANIKGIFDQTDNNSNSSQPSNHWTLTSTESSDDFDDEYNN